jgi:hypothetical protein
MDFIGPISTSTKGFTYILTMMDHYSKYAMAYATISQDTKTVIECLTKFFSELGIPEKLLSDNGRSFTSQQMINFCNFWGVKKINSSAYHPQSNGLIERYNKSIIQILKCYVLKAPEEWDNYVPLAVAAYNSSVHRITNCTPYLAFFGRKPTTTLNNLQPRRFEDGDISEYIIRMQREKAHIDKIIAERQEYARQYSKDAYDKTAGGDCFKEGDYVYLYNTAVKLGDIKKFAPCYKGPYVITAKVGETNFSIKPLQEGLREETVHQNRLKRAFLKSTKKKYQPKK